MLTTEGKKLCDLLAKMWQVDEDRVVWNDSGFDSWPGHFKVSVRVLAGDTPETEGAWRLSVRTDFLAGVNTREERIRGQMLQMGSFAPSHGRVAALPDVINQYGTTEDGRVELQTTVCVRPGTAGWLPSFLGRIAILQPIDAERSVDSVADLLGGRPDRSAPPGCSGDIALDDMINVAQALNVPEGQGDSQWQGCDEFEQVAQTYGRNDRCFGMGDASSVTLETPMGRASSLFRLTTTDRHPALGAGLLASVQLPFMKGEAAAADECLWLNFFESAQWTDVPQLGSWHPRSRNGEDYHSAQYSSPPTCCTMTF